MNNGYPIPNRPRGLSQGAVSRAVALPVRNAAPQLSRKLVGRAALRAVPYINVILAAYDVYQLQQYIEARGGLAGFLGDYYGTASKLTYADATTVAGVHRYHPNGYTAPGALCTPASHSSYNSWAFRSHPSAPYTTTYCPGDYQSSKATQFIAPSWVKVGSEWRYSVYQVGLYGSYPALRRYSQKEWLRTWNAVPPAVVVAGNGQAVIEIKNKAFEDAQAVNLPPSLALPLEYSAARSVPWHLLRLLQKAKQATAQDPYLDKPVGNDLPIPGVVVPPSTIVVEGAPSTGATLARTTTNADYYRHRAQRPAKNEKEKKVRTRKGLHYAVLRAAMEFLEFKDFIDMAYTLLDKSHQRKWIPGKPMLFDEKVHLVWKHWRDIDGVALITGIIANEIEDRAIGGLSGKASNTNRKIGGLQPRLDDLTGHLDLGQSGVTVEDMLDVLDDFGLLLDLR